MVLILLSCTTVAQDKYVWPTDASRLLTSAFGEHRPDRIHAGIDIKTWNRNGYKVFAVDDGYIVRLRTSPFGYGRVVYHKLKDGNIAVYAHLSGFSENLSNYMISAQEKRNQYSVDMWFKPDEIPVKRGEIIAFTGFSGSKLPHLHFELRDSRNRPLNPLLHGFLPEDKAPPVAGKISFTPINHRSRVAGKARPVIVRPENTAAGRYELKDPVKVWGSIGVGIDGFDINGLYDNYYGIYSLTMKLDGRELYSATFDRFSYDENKLINLDRDYRLLRQDKGKFYNLYLKQGNTLPFYGQYSVSDGIVTFEDNRTVPFEIILKDFQGNTSVLTGAFTSEKPGIENAFAGITNHVSAEPDTTEKPGKAFQTTVDYLDTYLSISYSSGTDLIEKPKAEVVAGDRVTGFGNVEVKGRKTFLTTIPYTMLDAGRMDIVLSGQSDYSGYSATISVHLERIPRMGKRIRLKNNTGMIIFSRGDLYSDFWFRHDIEEGDNPEYDFASDIVHLAPMEVPLRSSVLLILNLPENVPQIDKLAIYERDNDGEWSYIGHERDPRRSALRTRMSSLETVAVLRDTIPPEIMRYSPGNQRTVTSRKPKITVWFDDLLSGIPGESDIELYLDGTKVISEWIPAYDRVEYVPRSNLSAGTHDVRFVVSDRMGNRSELEWQFIVQ